MNDKNVCGKLEVLIDLLIENRATINGHRNYIFVNVG